MSSQPSSNVEKEHGFRKPLLYYLKNNANPKLLLKLMQVSKYFCFKEFPFMVVKDLENDGDNVILRNGREIEIYNDQYENLPKPLWITNKFNLYDPADSKLASKLLSKIAYCKVKELVLENQYLNLNEFQNFVSLTNFYFISFTNSCVKFANGTIISIEEILKLLPKLKNFEWSVGDKMASTFTFETSKAITDFFDPSILETFELAYLPQSFDFKLFAKFMDANPKIKFWLHFARPLSAEYTKMLQDYVDDFIESSSCNLRKILIIFPTQTNESIETLKEFYF